MNHICVLTLTGGSELLYKLEDLTEKPKLVLEFRGSDLSQIGETAMLALGSVKLLPATAKKKAMVLVGQEMINQTVAALKERSHQNFDVPGDINSSWRVYNVPDFAMYDKTYQV